MRFLEYLFFKYYNWQVKVGNWYIASFASICFMTFCILLYYLDIVMVMSYFIGAIAIHKYILIIMFIAVLAILYFSLVYHGRDMQIMERHKDEWTGKKNLGAIVFPIIAFVWFNVDWIVRMLMNRGVL